MYFRTPDGRSWDRTERRAGRLDTVPLDAPAETKQSVVNSWGPAEYRGSNTTTFTRDVDVLPEGHRLENWGASCGVGNQGTLTCRTYDEHGFMISTVHGVLW